MNASASSRSGEKRSGPSAAIRTSTELMVRAKSWIRRHRHIPSPTMTYTSHSRAFSTARSPLRWNLPEMLTISSFLGVSGVLASFLLFFLLKEQGFSDDIIRSMLFLKLIVAGHSTLYITRTGGWFWQRPYPAPLLLVATFGTEILGTVIAVYGFLVTPIGWQYALWMWAYALAWFVFNDVVKWGTYRLLRKRGAL